VSVPPTGLSAKPINGAQEKAHGYTMAVTAKIHKGDWYEHTLMSSMMKMMPNAKYATAAAKIGKIAKQHKQHKHATPDGVFKYCSKSRPTACILTALLYHRLCVLAMLASPTSKSSAATEKLGSRCF